MNPTFVIQEAKSQHRSAELDNIVSAADGGWTANLSFFFPDIETASLAFDSLYDETYVSLSGMVVDRSSLTFQKIGSEYRVKVSIETTAVVTIDQVDPVEKLTTDDPFTLTAVVSKVPAGESVAVTWASSDDAVATVVEATGVVTIVGAGTAVITATSVYNVEVSDTIDVVVS